MANIRVYELSRDLNKSNKEIINTAKGLGISVKSHASSISQEEADKIKDRILVSDNSESIVRDTSEETERIRVYKSESGAEVVERRKGSRVVLRRKKKVEKPVDPEVLEEAKVQEIAPAEEKLTAVPEKTQEPIAEKPPEQVVASAQTEVEPKPKEPAQQEDTAVQTKSGADKAKDVEERSVKKRGEAGKDSTSDSANKFKKKPKKSAKPAKEEIIDEDTLESLRKAFRTKLPGRKKREFLVDDRRPKTRPPANNAFKDRPAGRPAYNYRGNRAMGRTTPPKQPSEIIALPTKAAKMVVKIGESINLGDLAKLMGVKAGKLIRTLISLGIKATINQSLDHETATLIAEEFGFAVTVDIFQEDELLIEHGNQDLVEDLPTRPPVVTVMGHVDHGKTTLLDSIRNANVVEGEAGGITQHIGAYSVDVNGSKLAFVDTPGHEAFTAMRARGAKVTDIVVLVVAADDGVMPQTIEAYNHAKAAEVPVIVAINKIDRPDADTDKIKRQLSEIGLLSEEWGGDTIFAELSAKEKIGIKELLELILLQADILELKADTNKRANGFVIEAILDKGRGSVATVLVNEGTLKIGDYVVAGTTYGKVRALLDDNGQRVKEAGPSIPVEMMGISGVPEAGERFYVVKDEKTAKEVVGHRAAKEREAFAAQFNKPTLENLFEALEQEVAKELPIIVKADTQGSVEAVRESLSGLSTEKCQVKIVHTGVGGINETDVSLASASNAVIVGFNIRPDVKALAASEKEGVSLELHAIIYDLIDRVKSAMEGLLDPIVKEKILGHAEVRDTFHISRIGTIAGCMVSDGKVLRDSDVRVVREGSEVYDGKLESLKRFKDDVKEVNTGYECGISLERFNDIKVGDTFEFYTHEEFKQEL